ncbi:MAG: ferritin [bacterium JZ-2024 1]
MAQISKKIQDELNRQLNMELMSAYVYLAMAADFEDKNLAGFAKWMRQQWKEEIGHAMKFFDFINERQGRVILKAVDVPRTEWPSATEAFKTAYEHEKKVTASIYGIYEKARAEKDFATEEFLHWFLEEQVEEEDSTYKIWQKLEAIKEDPVGLHLLDAELGKRESE